MNAATLSPYSLSDTETITGEFTDKYVMRVRDLPNDKRPREKMLAAGPDAMSVAELVSILLGVGTKKEEVMAMASRILREYGERSIISERNPQRLADTLHIPVPKACQLVASFELGRRFFQTRAGKAVCVMNAQQAFEYLQDMRRMKKEQLKGLYLNSRYQVVHEEVISVGSLTSNIVHPREVFQPAIEYGAVAVIIAHNHPSGRLEPTYNDTEVTERLIMASKILGIDLLDHLVIAGDDFMSVLPDTSI